MSKQNKPDLSVVLDQYVVVGIGILAVLFVFTDVAFDILAFLYPDVKFLSLSFLIPKLTLFVLGYLFVSMAIERRKRLDYIQATLDGIVNNYSLGAQYLETIQAVNTALERSIRQADETVMAMGSRSKAVKYLASIQDAIAERSIRYYRLLEGPEITHELCEHLRSVLPNDGVEIMWTHKEKFGNLTVTEHECIIAFPAPHENELSGLRLPGETNSRRYTRYFRDVFPKGLQVRTAKSVEALCPRCSPATAGNIEEVRLVIAEELKSFVDKQTGIKPDLL